MSHLSDLADLIDVRRRASKEGWRPTHERERFARLMEQDMADNAKEIVAALRAAGGAPVERVPAGLPTTKELADAGYVRRGGPHLAYQGGPNVAPTGIEYYNPKSGHAVLEFVGVQPLLLEKGKESQYEKRYLYWAALTPDSAPKMLMQGLDTPERVRFYEHDFYVLSNFSAFNLMWRDEVFPTSEHAYHWEKFHDRRGIQDAIRVAPSAHAAFKMAEFQRNKRRSNWDAVKVDIMRDILRAKAAQHEYVRRKLLATGERELVEDSWRDDFWGWGPNRDGQNMLGKLWMDIRAEFRESSAPKECHG